MQNKTLKNKTIYFVRHAKSCWDNNFDDYDRPLNKRGKNDAHLISNYLININVMPQLILCSAAKRTKLTAEIFINNLNLNNVEINFLNELYDFSGENLLNVLKQINNSIDKVLVFGHNYALTNLVNKLGSTMIVNVPTSGVVHIDFEISDWKKIAKGVTKLTVFPKDLK